MLQAVFSLSASKVYRGLAVPQVQNPVKKSHEPTSPPLCPPIASAP
ncbi:hypothetical protein D082_03050 [Synechocystis sp. PCC 6714]|nr:hypothetical protein D082_03050 [Synechocystis sp. PCC 6714]